MLKTRVLETKAVTNTGVQRLISQNSDFLATWGFLNTAHLIHVHEDYDQAVVNYFSCTKSSTAQKTRIFYRVSSGTETFITVLWVVRSAFCAFFLSFLSPQLIPVCMLWIFILLFFFLMFAAFEENGWKNSQVPDSEWWNNCYFGQVFEVWGWGEHTRGTRALLPASYSSVPCQQLDFSPNSTFCTSLG